mmetsp:Transcript_71134/g.122241  ORF Transcript_71134/g.122241 Transcript_71134/m.122241 type:complete len:110 (-) Transcript_71134:358-687(-)
MNPPAAALPSLQLAWVQEGTSLLLPPMPREASKPPNNRWEVKLEQEGVCRAVKWSLAAAIAAAFDIIAAATTEEAGRAEAGAGTRAAGVGVVVEDLLGEAEAAAKMSSV